MSNVVENFEIEKERIEEFETKNNNRASFFLNSAWQIKPFFEEEARDKTTGQLIVPKS